MTYSTLLKIKNDAILVEYLICATELIASSEKGYKEFRNEKGEVYRATDYDPRLRQRVLVPIRGESAREGARAAQKAIAQEIKQLGRTNAGAGTTGIGNILSKNAALKAAAVEAAFGKTRTGIIDEVAGIASDIGEKARKIATTQYKRMEPRLEAMTGHEFEQNIQDALIRLKVLEKRDLREEVSDVRSVEEAIELVKNHQAEIVATAASLAGAAAITFGPQFLIALLIAASGSGAVDLGAIALEVFASMVTSEGAGLVAENVAKNFTDDKETLAGIHAVASFLTALATGSILRKSRLPKSVAQPKVAGTKDLPKLLKEADKQIEKIEKINQNNVAKRARELLKEDEKIRKEKARATKHLEKLLVQTQKEIKKDPIKIN